MKTSMSAYVPVVVTREADGQTTHQDLYSRLLSDRIIMIDGEIEPHMASIVVAELLYLQSEDSSKPISMYISSPGGHCSAGMSIVSTMGLVSCPVRIFAHGMIASMASVIASAGERGYRYVLPGTRVMLHQASSGTEGNVQDMRIAMEENLKVNDMLLEILAKNCGKTVEEVRKATERDRWLSDAEAVEFGLLDKIVEKRHNVAQD